MDQSENPPEIFQETQPISTPPKQTRKKFLFASLVSLVGLCALFVATIVSIKNQTNSQTKAAITGNSTIYQAQLDTQTVITPPPNTIVNKIDNGVYELKAPATIEKGANNSFIVRNGSSSCVLGSTGCEVDRYEIHISGTTAKIFGLGVTPFKSNKAELDDFLDTNFGFGHEITNRLSNNQSQTMELWNGDAIRGRTPIISIPSASLIIFYVQPEVKMLRLTRNVNKNPSEAFNCPQGKTCLVFKKHHLYPEGSSAPLVIIKGTSFADAYSKYFAYLDRNNFLNVKPKYATFGNNWETFQELGCAPTASTVIDASNSIVNLYSSKNIKLSTLTLGSGWWKGISDSASVGCRLGGDERMLTAATDAFAQNTTRFPSGLADVFSKIRSKGIIPILGMRPQIQPGDINNSNISVVSSKFGMPIDKTLLTVSNSPQTPAVYYNGDTFTYNQTTKQKYHYQLNVFDVDVVTKWTSLLKSAYGSTDPNKTFGGFKYDDMRVSDNKGYIAHLSAKPTPTPTPIFDRSKLKNDRDDAFKLPFETYYQQYGSNFLIFTPNNWFSQTDAFYNLCTSTDYWAPHYPDPNYSSVSTNIYKFKYCTDMAINTVLSGIPLQTNWGIVGKYDNGQISNYYDENEKVHFVRQHQLATWFPVTMFSPGYWRLRTGSLSNDTGPDTHLQNIVIWNMQMRQRLQRYAFDYASLGYEEKTSHLMRPLVFDYPNDPKANAQYSEMTSPSQPKNEYMFGKALLVRPVFVKNADSLNVYFPEGNWLPLISNPRTKGVKYLEGDRSYQYVPIASSSGSLDYPVFLKEGEILIIGDSNPAVSKMYAYVFFNTKTKSSIYVSYSKNGDRNYNLLAEKTTSGVKITATKNNGSGQPITLYGNIEPNEKGFYVVDVSSVVN